MNSVEYDGRPACNNCGFCGYYGCPIDAKGDPVAPLRHALRTGRCEIRPEAYVTDVLRDASGQRARGVRYLDHDLVEHEVSADHVVLAAGAFETPRLLLRTGLGNPDVVGRFLQYHFQTFVLGIFPYRLHGHRGRSVTHLMDDPIVPDAAALAAARAAGLPFLRGGIVEHGARRPPDHGGDLLPHRARARRARCSTRRCATAWRCSRCRARTCPRRRTASTSTRTVRDVFGHPAGRVTYSPHRHEIACAEHWAPRLEAVMREAGAEHTFWATSPPIPGSFGDQPGSRAPMSRHIMGSARMGDDPRDERVRPLAAAARDGERRLHRLVGVPDVDRLRPDAHDRGARRSARHARSPASSPLRSTRPDGPARPARLAASCRRCPSPCRRPWPPTSCDLVADLVARVGERHVQRVAHRVQRLR